MSSIGARIKALRIAHGLSGAELARRIGIKAPSLWEIENGQTKSVRGHTLAALCAELHTTQALILNGEPEGVSLQLATMEAELLFTIRALEPEKRIALMEYARFLRGSIPAKAENDEPAVKRASVSQIGKHKKR